jgi:carboxylesterase
MLHGFMGSPLSSYPMANYLAEHNITVHCPLLPGHGHHPDKLLGFNRQDWIAESEEAFQTLRGMCDEVFIIGHSMGSVLGARLCLQNPEVRGMVMLTPVYESPDKRLSIMKLLRYVMTWFYPAKLPSKSLQRIVHERALDFYPDIDLDSPEVKAQLPMLSRLPTASLAEMLAMIEFGRKLWPKLQTPSLILYGGSDPALKEGSIEKLYDLLPGTDKQIRLFPEAQHELMRPQDPVHEIAWKLIYDFVYTHSRAYAAAIEKNKNDHQ